jgi:mitochondrial fission protein ELM1
MQSAILSEAYAGLQAQALGLAEAAGLAPRLAVLTPVPPWCWMAPRFWPAPLAATGLPPPPEPLLIGCGGVAAAVGAALRRRTRNRERLVVQVQNPRMDLRRFDLVVANRHDAIAGPNVIVTRTALHRATAARLAAARAEWTPRLAHLPRPLVAVLVGGSNGRFRLEAAEAAALAAALAGMMRQDGAGVALTPSRRTAPAAVAALRTTLQPLGGWIWDGAGDNPYYGLLAVADAIVATIDSVSMISEAVATAAPVLVADLPGRSRRIARFMAGLQGDGRVRRFTGRLEMWHTHPLDDTQAAADEMRHRLGF